MAKYLTEAKIALGRLRTSCGWREVVCNSFRYSIISKIPKFKLRLGDIIGYDGFRVDSKNMRQPESGWQAKRQKFLP